MNKSTGFIDYSRKPPRKRPVSERIHDYREFVEPWSEHQSRKQGARCMACSVPFCHSGCPLGNIIPDFNNYVSRGQWKQALTVLHSTNNFPEFTGRICPAPCEASCVLSINQDPVTIEYIEKAISDKGWENGWIKPDPPKKLTGKRVGVIGSGPAGLAAAQQLRRTGHEVTVYERSNYIGGLLSVGIPNFKLDKRIVERRINQMEMEGVIFVTGVNVGIDYTVEEIACQYDSLLLAGGCTQARDLNVDGRDLKGVHLAMEYLSQQNLVLSGETVTPQERITAEGKKVVILGGGDTGADCLGTAHRQGATDVYQFELLPEPPVKRHDDNPWPQWPLILRTGSAHEEGGDRNYNILTKRFSGENGKVNTLHGVRVQWDKATKNIPPKMTEVAGSQFEIKADLVLLAMGFIHPEHEGVVKQLDLKLDGNGNVESNSDKMTSTPGVFVAGDMTRGQSLVVWAIAEGREAARGIDQYLMGFTNLPQTLR